MSYASSVRTIAIAALTPLLEKNVTKTLALDAPVILSMSRVIVFAFAVGMLKQIWHAGVAGWPDAALAMAVVLALPVLGALDRATPDQVMSFAKNLVGDVCHPGQSEGPALREPSKYDDHRTD